VTTEGALTVHLSWDGRRVRDVAISSSRPFAIGRLLTGRDPDEAAALLTRLYSLCAEAQGAAAHCALDAARGSEPDPRRIALLETRVLLETVQEHVWRLLLDWPAAMGHGGLPQVVATARRAIGAELTRLDADARNADAHNAAAERLAPLAAELAALLEQQAWGVDLDTWRSLTDATALAQWTAEARTLPAALLGELHARHPDAGRSDVPLMPNASLSQLLDAVVPALRANADFARAPAWAGTPVETGPLARCQAHPLIAALCAHDGRTAAMRMLARLNELALGVARLRGTSPAADTPRVLRQAAIGPGEGLGLVETARGLLLHRVRVEAGRVAAWDIVAPTEWNFHPQGPLARGLRGTAAGDPGSLTRAARIAVQAIDPCVACHIEVADA